MLGDFAVVVAKGSVLRGLEKPHSAEKVAKDFLRKLGGIRRQNFALILQNGSLKHNYTFLQFPSIY